MDTLMELSSCGAGRGTTSKWNVHGARPPPTHACRAPSSYCTKSLFLIKFLLLSPSWFGRNSTSDGMYTALQIFMRKCFDTHMFSSSLAHTCTRERGCTELSSWFSDLGKLQGPLKTSSKARKAEAQLVSHPLNHKLNN